MTAVAMHRLLVGVDAGRGVPEAHGDVGAQLHDTEAGHQGELEVARSLNRWRSLARWGCNTGCIYVLCPLTE